jgi:hypothetical protein
MLAIIGGPPVRFAPFAGLYREALERFDQPARPVGVHSPGHVARKIATNLTTLGATRFDLKYGIGGLSHEALMNNIELYGTRVIPRVRELLAAGT